MKLNEIVKLTEADDEATDDLSFNLDEPKKEKPEQPAKKPEKGKAPSPEGANDEEHKHPDDFKTQLLDLFKNASLQPYEKADVVQVRPATEGEEIQVDFPGEFKKAKVAAKGDYVVRDLQDPTKMKVVSKQELEREYTSDQAETQPDAEGFIKYIPQGQVIAFQYAEPEQLKLKDDNGRKITIQYGDYLGYSADDASELIRLDKGHFEKAYRLAK
jgi:hypothetical protein